MQTLKMPDITTAQLVAVVGSDEQADDGAGLDISKDLQDSIISLITVIGGLLLVSEEGAAASVPNAGVNQPKGEVADDGAKGSPSA